MSFIIRQLKEEEFPSIIEWSNEENWNLGTYDYQAFKQVDKEGFYFGEIDGKPMALLAAVKYDYNFGFMGFYIVKPQYRGKGYGKKLFNFALEQLAKHGVKNIGLEAIFKQVSRYQSHNFKFFHFTERYSLFGTNIKFQSPNLKLLKNIPFQLIVKYDQVCFSTKREKFLQKWISLPESYSIGFIQNEQIKGYAVLRKSANGYKIGPLFADNVQIAEQLLKSLCGTVLQNKQISVDIPDTNKNGRILIEKYKMTFVCKFARMYTKQMPKIPVDTKVFGFASVQLG